MAGRFATALGALAAALAAPALAKPVTLEDYLSWETAGGSEISPDGSLIAYRRTKVDPKADRFDSDLWIMRADGSDAHLLSDAWSPTWLPDGRLSYFIDGEKGPQLVIRSLDGPFPERAGAEVQVVIDGPSPSGLEWSRDGANLAYVASVPREGTSWPIALPARPEGAKWAPDPAIIDSLHYRTGADSYRNSDRHIFVVPAAGGKARQITHGEWNVGSYYSGIGFGTTIEWSADGKALYFDGYPQTPDTIASAQQSMINKVDIDSGAITRLTKSDGFWRSPRLSPDGRLIVYTGNRPTRQAFAAQQLRLMNADGSGDRVLLDSMPDRIFQLEWDKAGDAVLVSMNHEGATELWRVGLDGKVRVLAPGKARFYISSTAPGRAVGSYITHSRDSEVAAIDLATGALRRLTDHNRAADALDLASSTEVWGRSRDGTRVQGWLFKPQDYDPARKYPLILDIHGGPDAMGGYDFDFRYHDFAARGYLVATSNPGGSTGYGTAFANRIDGGFPGKRDREDLEGFLDAVIASASVDPARIYVMGCSGGGSLTNWLAAKTGRFAAAASMCAVNDWISFAGTSDAIGWAYTRFDKPFWEDPKPWLAHSPVMAAGEINIPTLIAVGARDQRTPVSQSAELYTALKVRGIPTRLLIFPNEGHGPWRSVPSDLLRLQLYLDDWFRTASASAVKP